MSPPPSRIVSRSILAACGAALFALVLFVALPPKGASLPPFFEFLGRFHTLLVHLPIGVLLLVATAEVLTRFPRVRERVDGAFDLALPFLVLTAVGAYTLGVLLARGGGYSPRLVGLHRTFTLLAVMGTGGCLVAWVTRVRPDGEERRTAFRATLGATVAMLTVGAHFGGSLTHGDTYLTRYAPEFVQRILGAPPPTPAEAVATPPSAEPLVFADVVLPLLKRECVECHGADKTKGGLRLDSLAAILKGGDDGAAVDPGHGATSSLVKRMLLPANDDDHMPPSEKTQPTPGEVQLLQWWIDRGATDTLKVRDAMVPEGARTILGQSLGGAAATPALPSTPAPPTTAPVGVAAMMPGSSASAPALAASAELPAGGKLAYRDVIAPLLANACSKCHGSDKQKGKLRVDSIASLTAGGKSGAGIVPGNGAGGTVLGRLQLSADDDKHMPPRDEPQLTPGQVAMIAFWIARGADETLPASSLPHAGTGLRPSAASHVPKPETSTTSPAAPTSSPPPPTAASGTPPLTSPAEPALSVGPGQIALYRDVVKPLLARRCGECHGATHAESGMRVDDLAKLVKDQELVPGKPKDSPIVQRMALPANNADRMPPQEKPPVDAWETEAVSTWVAAGGAVDAVVATANLPASVLDALHLPAATAQTPAAASSTTPTASAPPGTVVPLRASGCGACTVGGPVDGPGLALASTMALTLGLRIRRVRRRSDR
jgi:uncharacterized membrane protein